MTAHPATPDAVTTSMPDVSPVPPMPSVAGYTANPALPAPTDHLFASVCWLVARHPAVFALARRVPGVVDDDGDVLADVLADAFTDLATGTAAWEAYERSRPAPQDPDAYDAWADAGPSLSDRAAALAVMSRTEIARLRLLATLSEHARVQLRVGDLWGFDDTGHAYLADWWTATAAYLDLPGGPR